jgi:hypothetical protein
LAITQIKNIFPSYLLFKDANVQEHKIITTQLLSTGVMVCIPRHISWSNGTQTIRNVLQLLNTGKKIADRRKNLETKYLA